jgi:hypothetical protein
MTTLLLSTLALFVYILFLISELQMQLPQYVCIRGNYITNLGLLSEAAAAVKLLHDPVLPELREHF